MHSIKLTPKKKSNCNVMATWSYHVISLVISSNNILLSPPIAFTYYLGFDGSLFWYTKPYLSIERNQLFYIVLLKSISATIIFIGKRFLCHSTVVMISIHQHPICWDTTFFNLISLGFGLFLIALYLQTDDVVIDLFFSQVGGLQCDGKAFLFHTKL